MRLLWPQIILIMFLTSFVFFVYCFVCDILLHDGLFLSVICALQACYDDDELEEELSEFIKHTCSLKAE